MTILGSDEEFTAFLDFTVSLFRLSWITTGTFDVLYCFGVSIGGKYSF